MKFITYIEILAGLALLWFLWEEWRDRRTKRRYKYNGTGRLWLFFGVFPSIIIGFLISPDESILKIISHSMKVWILLTAPLFIACKYQILPFQLGEMKEEQ
jgi:hypothetical protein